MTDSNILHEADRLTSRDRQNAYGHPLDDYTRTAGMVSAMLAHKLTSPLTPEEMMLVMVQVKVSREINQHGDDNLRDGCGYLRCIEMAKQERERRQQPDPDCDNSVTPFYRILSAEEREELAAFSKQTVRQ